MVFSSFCSMAMSSFSFFLRSAAAAACAFRTASESLSDGDGTPLVAELSEWTDEADDPLPFALPLTVTLIVVPLLCLSLSLSFFSLSVPRATSSQ